MVRPPALEAKRREEGATRYAVKGLEKPVKRVGRTWSCKIIHYTFYSSQSELDFLSLANRTALNHHLSWPRGGKEMSKSTQGWRGGFFYL